MKAKLVRPEGLVNKTQLINISLRCERSGKRVLVILFLLHTQLIAGAPFNLS